METTGMKMEYLKQTDNGNDFWRRLFNIDELIWNGKYTLKVSNDDGSSQLPFLLGNDETASLVVQDHCKEGTHENGRTIVQTITRVDRTTGNVIVYARTRYNDGGGHAWSQWIAVSEIPIASNMTLGGVMIGDGLSINADGKVSVDGRFFEGNNFDKVNFAIYTNALNSQTGGNLFDNNSAGILTGKIFADDAGNFMDREEYDTSDYMAVVPGETYSCTQIVRKPSGYDLDKKFKQVIDYSNGVFQIPEGVYWIRLSYAQDWANGWCVNKGTSVLPEGQRTFGLMRTEKLYDAAVTAEKLADRTVTMEKLSEELKEKMQDVGQLSSIALRLEAYVDYKITLPAGTIITDLGGYEGNLLLSTAYPFDSASRFSVNKDVLPFRIPVDIKCLRASKAIDNTITYATGLTALKILENYLPSAMFYTLSGYNAYTIVSVTDQSEVFKQGRVISALKGDVPESTKISIFASEDSTDAIIFTLADLPYKLPFDVKRVRLSIETLSNPVDFCTISGNSDEYKELLQDDRIAAVENALKKSYSFPHIVGNMSDGTVLELEKNSVKTFKSLAFSADIVNFGEGSKLLLGHGRESEKRYGASWVEITSTSVSVKMWYAADNIKTVTYEHGLSINGNIQVLLSVDTGALTLKMASCGNVFEKTDIEWNTNGKIFAESKGCELTDASLSWNCKNFTADIWAFGDSYFGTTTTERWIKHLLDAGYHNILVNGYAGEAGTDALADLNALLQHGTPKYIFWCQGMNNADTSTAVNSTWESVLESVKGICASKNIELVLATIPTVPSRVHKYKNAIVRSSGYRYVDFDKAVGANESTGAWFDGMLSGDGVHPSTKGAVALFHKALADFPELMMANTNKAVSL